MNMTYKISEVMFKTVDIDSVVRTEKFKVSEEYKARQRMKSKLMNSLYVRPKNYGGLK